MSKISQKILLEMFIWLAAIIQVAQQIDLNLCTTYPVHNYCNLEIHNVFSTGKELLRILESEECSGNNHVHHEKVDPKNVSYLNGLFHCLSVEIKSSVFNNKSTIQFYEHSADQNNLYCYLCIMKTMCGVFNYSMIKDTNLTEKQMLSFDTDPNYNQFYNKTLHNCFTFEQKNVSEDFENDQVTPQRLAVLVIVSTICFFCIFGNAMLIIICTCNQDMRTDCNKIIVNLAISDILYLSLNCYFYTCDTFFMLSCADMVFVKTFIYYTLNCVCSYTVAALSLQRYLVVLSVEMVQENRMLKILSPTAIISFVWLFAIAITLFFVIYLVYGFGEYISNNFTNAIWIAMFITYCLIPFVIIITCSIITSWRIKKFIRQIPGDVSGQKQVRRARLIGSNVLIALVLVFTISYFPYYFIVFLKDLIYIDNYTYEHQVISQWLVILNSCFNPLALYIASGKFRNYFNRYFSFSCKYRKKHPPSSEVCASTIL
ncbi:hypothetical protein C0J52_06807 [Blattella germanica]|nr:hypothetical protein C0J52_06807 [Blattella germanica]